MFQIGIVSHDEQLITPISNAVQHHTHHQIETFSGNELNSFGRKLPPLHLLIIDLDGVIQGVNSLLESLAHYHGEAVVVLLMPPENPLAAEDHGVEEIMLRPANQEQMQQTVRQFLQMIESLDRFSALKEELRKKMCESQIVARSQPMRKVLQLLPRVAGSETSVLITGETGTGKELIARAIHYLSPRAGQPFVAIDCANIPEHLVENELFGHVRGAYTDAGSASGGLLKEADGGTLFLDEVEALPLSVQAKFLRFLQERQYKPLGQSKCVSMDVRVLAATNIDLGKAVKEKAFREDLYFRLNVVPLFIPPLRERKTDIPVLVHHFLQEYGQNDPNAPHPPRETMQNWMAYHWPGNVRELENRVQEWLMIGSTGTPPDSALIATAPPRPASTLAEVRREALEKCERAYLHNLLSIAGGNISAAARLAGIDRKNLRRLLAKYSIDARRYHA